MKIHALIPRTWRSSLPLITTNAIPSEGYVELNLNGRIFKLIPNGDKPGLCDIMP
jgi:hypothetical protein